MREPRGNLNQKEIPCFARNIIAGIFSVPQRITASPLSLLSMRAIRKRRLAHGYIPRLRVKSITCRRSLAPTRLSIS